MTFVRIAAAAVLCALLGAHPVLAQERFPQRPVRLIMPFAPGGGSDVVGRIVARELSERWAQPVVVDSRLGAAGTIASELVARAAPDGYTLLFNTAAMLIAPNLHKSLPFDPLEDFVPISKLGFSPAAVLIGPQVKADSIADFIALAKAPASHITYGSAGNGSAVHLATELFRTMAQIRMQHVPYKGGNLALTDLFAGRIQLLFSPLGPATGLAQSGKVKLIAVTTAKRSPLAPDVPTVAESGLPGYDFSYWWGIFAPARTPAARAAQLNRDIVQVVQSPQTRSRFDGYGVTPVGSSLAEFAAEVRNEASTWAGAAKKAGVTPQ